MSAMKGVLFTSAWSCCKSFKGKSQLNHHNRHRGSKKFQSVWLVRKFNPAVASGKRQLVVLRCGSNEAPRFLTDDLPDANAAEAVSYSMEKIARNKRKISASILIGGVPLQTVWDVLTDYEGLADFIPGLASSQILQRTQNGAQLLQIGEQDLPLGVKFRARGVIEVTEMPPQLLQNGVRRDIGFEMIEGDFEIFRGIWQIEQQLEETVLYYSLEVQPKIWLPAGLVEGRLEKEVRTNLTCVRDKALCSLLNSS